MTGLTVITLTGGRPEAFALLRRWIHRQTFSGPVRWIVIDDCWPPTSIGVAPPNWAVETIRVTPHWRPGENTQMRNLKLALSIVGDDELVTFMEDDECYAAGWLDRVAREMALRPIVGQRMCRKYNLATRRYRELLAPTNASLCATAVTGAPLAALRNIVATTERRIVDRHLWRMFPTGRLFSGSYVTSLKRMPGRDGIDSGHRADFGDGEDDAEASTLRRWLGADFEHYERFIR